MVLRAIAACALACAVASSAGAKDVCVGLDFAVGATLLLKGIPGKGSFGPVDGYINFPSPTNGADRLGPVTGQAIVSSAGDLVLGLTWHEVALGASGGTNVLNDLIAIHLACHPGSDGKLGIDDVCETFVDDEDGAGQLISCKSVAPVP